METTVSSIEELAACANNWLTTLPKEGMAIVALSGDLGAGKTSFVQCVARTLGVRDSVNSPTFVLEKSYATHTGRFKRLIHIDAYRLQGEDDHILDLPQLSLDSDNLIMIEWPEYLEHPPLFTHRVAFQWVDDSTRRLTFHP